MIRFHLLGTLELTGPDGAELRSILAQPKRAALLAFLAAAAPRGFSRRDTVVALLWPELDAEHARGALSKAVHHLRRTLGKGVLLGRGDEELGLAPERFWSDVAAFDAAASAGRPEDMLALYRGPLLDGFHLSRAPEFERWLERERERLRAAASGAARALAEEAGASGDLARATHRARQASALSPYDEAAARDLLLRLDRAGDRAGALRAYEEFARRLAADLEVEPSEETTALVETMRGRRAVAANPPRAGAPPRLMAPAAANGAPNDISPAGAAGRPVPFTARSTIVRRWRGAALSALVLLAALAAWWSAGQARAGRGTTEGRAGDAPPAPVPPHSVAVLPFVNLGSDPADEYLSHGISEELINALGQVPGLTVSARTSSFFFKEKSRPIEEIARQLKVAAVLEGSVQRAANRVRVTVRLVDGRDGYELWSRGFDRDAGDIFAIRDEIARLTAEALRPGVIPPGAAASPGRRAYELYLLGLHERRKPNAAGKKKAIEYLEAATEEEPRFAQAHALLALTYGDGPLYGALTWKQALERANLAASRALAIDSTVADAYIALGLIRFLHDRDWPRSELALRRALELNPNSAAAYVWYSQLLAATGRLREAEVAAERMFALDPLTIGNNATRGLILHHLRRYEDAIAQFRQTLLMDSGYTNAYMFLTRPLMATGRYREAAAALARWAELTGRTDPGEAAAVALAMGDSTRRPEAMRVLARWELSRPGVIARESLPLGLTNVARFYTMLGDRDKAITLLHRAHRNGEPGLYAIAAEPLFDPLRTDPRYQALLRDMGLR